jgi:hypothetical protein
MRAKLRACGWLVFLAAAAVIIRAMRYVADRCKSLRHFSRRLDQSSRSASIRHESPQTSPIGAAHSAPPLPNPECNSAIATTLPTAPPPVPLVYSDVV